MITPADLFTQIKTITKSHPQVSMCHFGTISDISSPKDGIAPNYPYVFYIIDSMSFTRKQWFITISGIFQTRVEDEENAILKGQSDMASIARDLYSIYTIQAGEGNFSMDKNGQVNVIPFVERLQDTVAGVTVTYNFEIDSPASKCYFNPTV